ncbi:MAG: AAA family ATPase [Lachnospiraceae bacterium]|nr:AAA family ATPase [Lachnospiraceae bacterium]
MKLVSARIDGFGKLSGREVRFGDHVTILSGENEAGKSTVHAFLRCMLFGQERKRGRAARSDDYSRYLPWEDPSVYGGALVFEAGGRRYLLRRSFSTGEASLSDMEGGEHLSVEKDLPALLAGLTPALFDNTLSVGQLRHGATDESLLTSFQDHFGAIRDTGAVSLRLTAASDAIRKRRRALERKLNPLSGTDAERLEEKILALTGTQEDLSGESEGTGLSQDFAQERARYEDLTARLSAAEEELSESPFENKAAASLARNRFENALATRRSHRPYAGEEGTEKTLGLLSDVLYYLMLAVFLIGEFYFLTGKYLGFFLLFGRAVVLFLGSRYLEVRRARTETYRMADDYVRDVLEEQTGERRYTREGADDTAARLRADEELFDEVSDLRAKAAAQADRVVSLRTQLSAWESRRAEMERRVWEQERREKEAAAAQMELAGVRGKLSENEKIREEIAVCDRVLEVYGQVAEELRSRYGAPLNEEASKVIAALTEGRYTQLLYDESGRPSVMDGYRRVYVDSLSRGTVEQLYLALRIGAVRLFWPEESMPLLLDDCFAFYDADRLLAALKYLTLTYEGQVILFTCHDREGEICEAEGLLHEHIFMG